MVLLDVRFQGKVVVLMPDVLVTHGDIVEGGGDRILVLLTLQSDKLLPLARTIPLFMVNTFTTSGAVWVDVLIVEAAIYRLRFCCRRVSH